MGSGFSVARSIMTKQVLLVLFCLVVTSWAAGLTSWATGLTCTTCSTIANSLSTDFRTEEAYEAQLNLTIQPVCQKMSQYKDRCYADYPGFWRALNAALWAPYYGWWSPKYLCVDVCPQSAEGVSPAKIRCKDCETRISISYSYMQKKDTLAQIVSDLKKFEWCKNVFPADVDYCNKGLEVTVMTALPILANHTDWIPVFCQKQMKCV